MNFKFHDDKGNEVRIFDPNHFIALVKNKTIQSDTLLFDEETRLWKPADKWEAFHWALQTLHAQQNPYPYPAPNTEIPIYGATPMGAMPANPYSPINYAAYESEPPRTWRLIVASLVFILGMGLIIFSMFQFSRSAYEAGQILGQSIVWSFLAFIIALVIWLVPHRKSKITGFAILAVCFFFASIITSAKAWFDYRTGTATMTDIAAMLEQINNDQTIQLEDINEKRYGSYTPMVRICYEYFQNVKGDFQQLNQKFEDLQINNLLQKETYQDAAHLDNGKKRIQSALESLDQIESLQRQRTDEVVEKINRASLPLDIKEDFVHGFNATKEQELAEISEFFAIERKVYVKIDEILNFMKQSLGKYSFQSGQLIFKSTAAAQTYNDYLSEIEELATQEDEWKQNAARRGQENLNRVQKELNRK
jgi:hypothetical protein